MTTPPAAALATGVHPIDTLIRTAESTFLSTLASESPSLSAAASTYRRRRGRHPPPGFDTWYRFATSHDAVMVEEYFDQIYHDLEPFWGVEPGRIRADASGFEMRIRVRDGKAEAESNWPWTRIWLGLVGSLEGMLPDVDLAVNAMDEPRVVVGWEEMEGLVEVARTRGRVDGGGGVKGVEGRFGKWKGEKGKERQGVRWEDEKQYWKIARRGCPPDSPARQAEVVRDFDRTPYIVPGFGLEHMWDGYVANYTLSTDFCHQPDLQGLNGIFVEPLSTSSTSTLFPLFGGSKLSVNNDILLPAPVYWSEEERFMGTDDDAALPWDQKYDMAIWRGVATGGRNKRDNWKAFQRHRFVAMNNSTKLMSAEEGMETPVNFMLPSHKYRLGAQENGELGEWVESWSDVSFTDLMCDEKVNERQLTCDYTSPHFALGRSITMAEQFQYKYLPDIDGNSFSGRYLGFLRSTSLPIKATLWKEWHDSRLTPWKHFVPMDNRYGDWYGIMEYFLGYGDDPGRNGIAERIAMAGREWASKVLRREDMQIYVLRLLLEYARVSDDRRESMGWVEDLL